MKKGMKLLVLTVLGIFLISFGMSFVSAAPDIVEGTKGAITGVYDVIRPLLEGIIGETSTGEFFLAKLLFLVVIFAIVWKVMEKIPFFDEHEAVLWVISIAVSILAIRWFGNVEIVKTVLLPYSVLGIAISAGIPLILAFFIIESFKHTMRKIGWIFFSVIFIFLWFTRYDELGSFGFIYLITAGISILFLIMDGTIQEMMNKMKVERINSSHKNSLAGDLGDEMKKLTDRFKHDKDSYLSVYHNGKTGREGWRDDMKTIKKNIITLKSS
jgi:hypothetical protein